MNEYFEEYSSVPAPSEDDLFGVYRHSFEKRTECVRKYSFAIPDDEAIEKISRYSPLIEIGAGSGYWAYLLDKAGADIKAYDNSSWGIGWDKTWYSVQEGDHNTPMEDRNLFLCWPDYNTPFAYNCLKNFKGKFFIYIGEGDRGCTGDDKFHEYLEANFKCIEGYEIPQWSNIHDYLHIYERLTYINNLPIVQPDTV